MVVLADDKLPKRDVARRALAGNEQFSVFAMLLGGVERSDLETGTEDPAMGATGSLNSNGGPVNQADCVACALVTLSACGPFCPWTISNSTSSPSWRLL